jgi:shikimate kinase / 3-dehydroquinate synthase
VRVFLIGYPAAGKSTVGRELAARFGWPFVDLDDEIAGLSNTSVAQLVQDDLEDFRRCEADALLEVAARSGSIVVATGGGAATWGDNFAIMQQAGTVIALTVAVATAMQRAANDRPRPLLTDEPAAQRLWQQRAAVYRKAICSIATDDRSVASVVDEVAGICEMHQQLASDSATAAHVYAALGERSYPIVVDDSIPWLTLVHRVADRSSKVAVVYDSNLETQMEPLRAALAMAWPTPKPEIMSVAIPAGESSKSMQQYQRLCSELLQAGLDRSSTIVAVGGGVVGDLAGFVAATLLRGIAIVHVPTTLVAMTDSAIGGKTAIDTVEGKNLVGAFWQPQAVLCGLSMLDTLPIRERQAGFGELWKYALLDGQSLWSAVATCAAWASSHDPAPPQLREVILRCAAYKAEVVSADERERTGRRALLNLGHTVGHAIESAANYSLSHGESVGLGLIAACRISSAMKLLDGNLEARVVEALASSGLRTDLDAWLTAEVLSRLVADKKRKGKTITYICIASVGNCVPVQISLSELEGILLSTRVS